MAQQKVGKHWQAELTDSFSYQVTPKHLVVGLWNCKIISMSISGVSWGQWKSVDVVMVPGTSPSWLEPQKTPSVPETGKQTPQEQSDSKSSTWLMYITWAFKINIPPEQRKSGHFQLILNLFTHSGISWCLSDAEDSSASASHSSSCYYILKTRATETFKMF